MGTALKNIEDDAFSNCKALKIIDLPNSIETIGSSAFRLSGLIKIVIPNNIKKLSTLVFSECANLKDVTLGTNIAIIESFAFYNTAIERIIFPKKLKKISEQAFACCKNLKEVVFEGIPKEIDTYMFVDCISVNIICKVEKSYAIRKGFVVKELPDGTLSVSYDTKNYNPKSILVPSNIGKKIVKKVESGGFSECVNLNNVVISNNIKIIGYDAFWNCKLLKDVLCSDDLKIVKDEAFADCENLLFFRAKDIYYFDKSAFSGTTINYYN